jgi:hypothetical protein
MYKEFMKLFVKRDKRHLKDNLSLGTIVDPEQSQHWWPIVCINENPLSDDDKRAWLARTLNTFVNVLRPRLRKWYEETQR